MSRLPLRRALILAVGLWLPTLLIATVEVFFAAALLPGWSASVVSWVSSVLMYIATAAVCLYVARRWPRQAWPTLAAALLIAYFSAFGLCLLLRIDLSAATMVLLADAVLWLLAAASGTALGLRTATARR